MSNTPKRSPKHRRTDSTKSDDEASDQTQDLKNKNIADLVKGPWKKAEDELLVQLVDEHGAKDWSKIANQMANSGHVRMGKQCRERWFNHLSPEVRKEAWTPEEDKIIIEAHRQLGNKWTAISRLLQGRPANAIKNHWNSTLKRQVGDDGSSPSPTRKRQRTGVRESSRKKRRLDIDDYFSSVDSTEEISSNEMDLEEEEFDEVERAPSPIRSPEDSKSSQEEEHSSFDGNENVNTNTETSIVNQTQSEQNSTEDDEDHSAIRTINSNNIHRNNVINSNNNINNNNNNSHNIFPLIEHFTDPLSLDNNVNLLNNSNWSFSHCYDLFDNTTYVNEIVLNKGNMYSYEIQAHNIHSIFQPDNEQFHVNKSHSAPHWDHHSVPEHCGYTSNIVSFSP